MKFRISNHDPILFELSDNVEIYYLNLYRANGSFCDQSGCLKCSPNGPDIHKITSIRSIKNFLKDQLRKTKPIIPSTSISINETVNSSSLLSSFLRLPNDKSKADASTKIMDNTGATLVIIEGSVDSLQNMSNFKYKHKLWKGKHQFKKPYLIPNCSDSLSSIDRATYTQRFHLHKKGNPLTPENGFSCHIDDFDELISSDSDYVSERYTTCYNLEHFPNGLIFAFRRNDNLEKSEIVEEIVLKLPLQPNEIFQYHDAIVISQWYLNTTFHHVSQEAVNIVHNVYGQSGFGNRSCASCMGTNVYRGDRQSTALIGNPL